MVVQDHLNIANLNQDKFVNGKDYQYKYFYSDLQLNTWIVFHNNWLFSFIAKRYKFKEYKMWLVDTDKYYSNTKEKYMTYSNPIDFGITKTIYEEEKALKNAFFLALLMDRILILPKFHCYTPLKDRSTNTKLGTFKTKRCNYIGNYNIKSLEQRMEYRENVFLESTLVPIAVKISQTSSILIDNYTSEFSHYKNTFSSAAIRVSTKGTTFGQVDIDNLLKKLEKYSKFSVLTFHSLYGDLMPKGDKHFLYHLSRVEGAIKRLKK